MSEYELIYLASEYINRTWNLLQFWASVSFGLIAVSHIASRHLTWAMVSIVSLLYVSFSIFVMSMISLNEKVVDGFLMDLEVLLEAGTLSTRGAEAIISFDPNLVQRLAIMGASIGTCISTLFFLWYCFIRARRGLLQEK